MAVTYQQFNWPVNSAITSNASVGPNNSAIPGESTLIGGTDGSGILRPVSVTSAGVVNVAISSGITNPLPTKDAADGTIGVAIGTIALLAGLKNASGNLQALQGDSSNNLLVSAIQNGTWTVAQGTPAATANGWPIKVTDGTNVAAVKAASTAPIATDPALVVTISPNSTGPISGTVTANQGTPAVTSNAWPIKLTDGTNTNTLKPLGTQVVSTDVGAVVNAVIHGLNSGGGGTYVDVKVTPSGSITTADNADGTPGSAIPGSAIMIGLKNPSSNLAAAICDSSSNLYVNIAASSVTIPVSGTVTANQGTSPWVSNISQFGGNNVVTGTGTSGVGIPRVTVSNDSNVLATQSGTWTVQQGATPTSVANAWPIKLTDGTNTTAVKAASTAPTATDPAAVVTLSPNSASIAITAKGTASANAPVYNVYGSTPISTSAYTQLVASTSNAINTIFIFDSSGQAMILATGGAGVETIQLYIQPGGGVYSLAIAAGTRIAYKALTANATTGYLLMSFLQ